jgi:RNA polymerase sigma factor (TIGR02999 family)
MTESGANMAGEPGEVTVLLHRWRNGDKEAESQLFRLLMPELHKIAGCCFRSERPGHTIQPTALVNEAFLRLASAKNIAWHDRGHFLAVAARVMRRVLIDHARSRPTVKFVPMEGLPAQIRDNHTPLELMITLDVLLDELELESPEKRTIVDLKNVIGLTDPEVAKVLNISLRTVQREWHDARVWLFKRISERGWKAALNTNK